MLTGTLRFRASDFPADESPALLDNYNSFFEELPRYTNILRGIRAELVTIHNGLPIDAIPSVADSQDLEKIVLNFIEFAKTVTSMPRPS